MTEDQLVAIIKAYRAQSLGVDDNQLTSERAKAMDRYHGRLYGDEQDGRSKVVAKDLSETVDWIMPTLMRIFIQSGNMVEFVGRDEEDEAQAEQESDYINYVIMQENEGFTLLHDACKDTLLLKNGYFKHFWSEETKIIEREFKEVDEIDLTRIMMQYAEEGAEVEITEEPEQYTVQVPGEQGLIDLPVMDVRLKVIREISKTTVVAVPPEELRISKKCRGSLQDSPFTEHVTTKTRSELIEMGMDKDFVNNLPGVNQDADSDQQTQARNSIDDEHDTDRGLAIDSSMDDIEYCEAYIKVDFDDDGIAELRKVVMAGGKIPPGKEWNEVIDMVALTGMVAKRVPHRHIGESIYDDIADLTRIKTVLMRNMLDNIYSSNNNEIVVNERVHLEDFLQALPNGVKRVNDEEPVDGAFSPIIRENVVDKILPAINYIDDVKDNRTGINDKTTNLSPDVLKGANNAVFEEAVQRASQKVEMIARMLAETGIKELFKRVHEITTKHQDRAKMVKLRGHYVNVNPLEWRDRTDLTVKVGLGTGTQAEKRDKLTMIDAQQQKLAQLGLVNEQKAYNLYADMAKTLDFQTPERYALDPESEEFQQIKAQAQNEETPNPLAEAEQVKGMMKLESDKLKGAFQMELDRVKQESTAQVKLIEQQSKAEIELLKKSLEMEESERQRRHEKDIEIMRTETQALIEGFKLDIGQPGIGAEVGQDSTTSG